MPYCGTCLRPVSDCLNHAERFISSPATLALTARKMRAFTDALTWHSVGWAYSPTDSFHDVARQWWASTPTLHDPYYTSRLNRDHNRSRAVSARSDRRSVSCLWHDRGDTRRHAPTLKPTGPCLWRCALRIRA